MKIALGEEIKSIDKKAVEEGLMPSIVLLENAGYAVANQSLSMFSTNNRLKKVCVFAGKGNNGGDAFVAARYLANSGITVRVFVLAEEQDLSNDAQKAFAILKNMNVKIEFIVKNTDWNKVNLHVAWADLVIDGMLGTGFSGQLQGDFFNAVECINSSNKPVLSIDIPSGVNADTGSVETVAILATSTISFVLPKMGLFLLPGKSYVGDLVVAQIGIPNNIVNIVNIEQNVITADLVRSFLPQRAVDAHKNQAQTAVVAGNKTTSGAAALCSEAALRSGSGIVKLFTPKNVFDILAVKLTEVMVDSLDYDLEIGVVENIENLFAKIENFHCLAVGPGLGTKRATKDFVIDIIKNTDKKLVLDADALNIIADNSQILKETKQLAIITPHLGEMARLTGLSIEQMKQEGIVRIARRFAVLWRTVVALKGVPTIVALPDGQIFVNINGNKGMATAGSGDVLTGIISGFLAQGLPAQAAAICGVYIHSLAGDIVAKEAQIGMAAGDIISAIPRAIADLNNG